MKKYVSIQNEVSFMSFDEKCKCKPEWVYQCHEKFDEEKVFQVWRNVFWVKVKSGEVSEKLILKHWSVSHLKNLVCEMKIFVNGC